MPKLVTIVGVGALGSHLVQFLRSEDVVLRIVDHDRVEQKNTQSQFHGLPSRGKNKTQALAGAMQMLFGAKLKSIPHKLCAENVDALLGGDLVVDCLDNAASRALVQNWVRMHGVPCLHGALAPDGSFGRVVWDRDFAIDEESAAGAVTCADGEFLPFIAVTAAYLARAAQCYLREGQMTGYEISPGGCIST